VSRYLVTGCAGFIGSHLSERLVARGDEVVGVDSFAPYYPRAAKEANVAGLQDESRFTLVDADLAHAPLGRLLDGVDGVVHLAGQPGVRPSWGRDFAVYLQCNLLATQRIFEASAARGLRVVFASSSSIYGDAETYPTREDTAPRPISPYGVSKLACEQLAHAYATSSGLDFVALRYFTVYGPRQRPDMAFSRIISSLFAGRPFQVFGSGDQSRDFTYVDDATSATLRALADAPRGAVYNVGGGCESTLRHVIWLCERLTGRTLNSRFEHAAVGDVRRTSADTGRIRAELGWRPSTPLSDGLARQVELAVPRPATRRPRRRPVQARRRFTGEVAAAT
jgi:nucleoside-diphosphate-sugar epimerase